MIALDGRDVTRAHRERCDVAVVGSGPAGATVARSLARAGLRVCVLEEGHAVPPGDLPADAFAAMTRLYRDMGTSLMRGRAPMPFVQGRVVGGTSVINGAISWRLPRDVYDDWIAADPTLADALPWERLEERFDTVEADLGIAPTDPAIAGPNNLLLGRAAEALGLEHRPIRRNVRGCVGLGRCMQGCPEGYKMAMDRSYLPDAARHGARLLSGVRVEAVRTRGGRATGVAGVAAGGGEVEVTAERAVVVAASAVQTPALLQRSGIREGPVGDGFMCHPGVSVVGRFPDPVNLWTGATQGHEVTGLRREGIKLEALGFDVAVLASRTRGIGRALVDHLDDLPHLAAWGAAIRSVARGRVRAGRRRAKVRFTPAREDVARFGRAVGVLCDLMLAAGATEVYPGVHGLPEVVHEPVDEFPAAVRAYTAVVTHMFGTCRMGSDPADSVVRPDFRHHALEGLYVADSSVFPSNTGVNPQTSIIALAGLCAEAVLAGGGQGGVW